MPETTARPETRSPSLGRTHQAARQIAAASRIAVADRKVIYTPLTWALGWVGRIIVQVLFFALIGLLLDDPDAVLYLFVGQAVMACVVEVFMSVASTTWERREGTLALLVAAPGPIWPVFVGRSLQWVPTGIATSSIVLFGVGPFLGITWTLPRALAALGCVALVAAGSYAVALVPGAVVLRGPRWRNVVSNLCHTTILLLCGVTVPVTFWPDWCAAVGQALPLSHGLEAVRLLAAGGPVPAGEVAALAGLTLLAGLAWLVAATAAFTVFARAAQRDGSVDFAE